jgi:hypothetical protein
LSSFLFLSDALVFSTAGQLADGTTIALNGRHPGEGQESEESRYSSGARMHRHQGHQNAGMVVSNFFSPLFFYYYLSLSHFFSHF